MTNDRLRVRTRVDASRMFSHVELRRADGSIVAATTCSRGNERWAAVLLKAGHYHRPRASA